MANADGPNIKIGLEDKYFELARRETDGLGIDLDLRNSDTCVPKGRALQSVASVYPLIQEYNLLQKRVCLIRAELRIWEGKWRPFEPTMYMTIADFDDIKLSLQRTADEIRSSANKDHAWQISKDPDGFMKEIGFRPLKQYSSQQVQTTEITYDIWR